MLSLARSPSRHPVIPTPPLGAVAQPSVNGTTVVVGIVSFVLGALWGWFASQS